jgi:hypothetical protein
LKGLRIPCVVTALGGCLALFAAPRPERVWAALEARKAVITRIEVEVVDVFDLAQPSENIWVGRMANRLHMTTHEVVIRRILLFAEGDPVHTRRIYETERLLRALPFVKDAHIDPVVQPDRTVVARVRVRDAWTTQVNAGFSSVGGQKAMNFGIDEKNFMGMGKSVAFDTSRDHERSSWGLTYVDPQFLGSRWNLMVQSQYQSDGSVRHFSLGKPFFALSTPWSMNTTYAQARTKLYFYDQGEEIYQAPYVHDAVQWTGALAFHETGNRVWRGGLLVDRSDSSYGSPTQTGPPDPLPPPVLTDRRLRGAGLTLSTQADAYDSYEDLLGMDTPEDYNLAWNGGLTLGLYSRSMGSSATAPFFLAQGTKGWSSSPEDLTLLSTSASGRRPASGLENGQMNLTLVQYCKLTSNQIAAGLATVDLGHHLDPENIYYLGGVEGLRGYPNYIHPGDARWLVSADYRLLTEQRWWGIVRLGFTAFVDAGSIRQFDGLGWSRVYSDLGVGLRLGNLKSSIGRVILITVAAPLSREPYQAKFQFAIGNVVRF